MRGGTVGGKFQDCTAKFKTASLDPKRQKSPIKLKLEVEVKSAMNCEKLLRKRMKID